MITITSNINQVIARLKAYEARIPTRLKLLAERLAQYGKVSIAAGFSAAAYDGDQTFSVNVVETATGCSVVVNGQAVAFIEFGAGVRYGYGYPGVRPAGIVGIGEYGYGQGANLDGWTFGEGIHTYGNAPYAPIYYAAKELRAKILTIAQGVFA
jgi:hypothetical protein